MCELLAVRSARPFELSLLWPLVERVERFGVAGFGWGVAWRDEDGELRAHRDPRSFRDDAEGRQRAGLAIASSVLVHLRRPSRLSTQSLADTQPFLDPHGRFAFAHNGDLRELAGWRDRFRREGRIQGRADSEVGARWLEDQWPHGEPPVLLGALHDAFGGDANLGVLDAGGTAHVYAGNPENPVFAFRVGQYEMVSTGLYSLDRSFFRLVAPKATDRRLIRFRSVATLGSAAAPATGVAASPG